MNVVRTVVIISKGEAGGGTPAPTNRYLRPDGTSLYKRPDTTSEYERP